MNYLAHLFIAGDRPESILGQMVADFVKPREMASYSAEVQAGIVMHQQVDSFTDGHRIVGVSKRRMPPPYRRYAGILVDLFYDHFLATEWARYSPDVTLEEFSQGAYRVLRAHEPILPLSLRRILPSMIQNDWLTSYREIENIERALGGISRRLRRENPLPTAVSQLHEHYGDFRRDFVTFFPELLRFVHARAGTPVKPGGKPPRPRR